MSIVSIYRDNRTLAAAIATEEGSAPEEYYVEFDQADDIRLRPLMALDTTASLPDRIPAAYESHPYNPWWYCVEKSVEYVSSCLWKVTVHFKYVPDPLSQPAVISYDFVQSTEPVEQDADGNALLNSADEPFDPPPSDEVYDLVMAVEVNWGSFDALQAAQYINAINSDVFFYGIFSPATVRCTRFSGTPDRVANLEYYKVSLEFAARADGWKRRLLDQGYRIKTGTDDDGNTTYQQLKDEDGNLLTQPVLLDGNGERLAAGQPPVYLESNKYKSQPFALFGLG